MRSFWSTRPLSAWLWPPDEPGLDVCDLHDRRWMRLIWLYAFAIVAVTLAAAYLPMADLPQHSAQLGMLRHFENYAEQYELNWFTPYLLGYGFTYGLSWIVGITAAVRLMVGIALAAFPLCTALLLREAGSRPGWALLTIPGLFGFCYDWGFLNYLISAPLLLAVVALAVRWSGRERLQGWQVLSLVAAAQLLLLSHIIVYALGGLVVAGIFLFRGPALLKRCLRVAYFASAVPVALGWMARTHSLNPQVREPLYFDLSWGRLGYLGSDIVGLEAGPIYATLGWLALTLPWLQGARWSRQPHRWIPLVLVTLLFLLGPTRAFGTHFIANRLSYFIMPFYLFALTPRHVAAGSRLAPMMLAANLVTLCFGFWARDTYRFHHESVTFNRILEAIEPGKTALYLPFISMSAYSPAPAYLHFGSYYTAAKRGDVDFNFAQFFPNMVRIKDPASRPVGAGFSFAPGHFDWQRHRGDNYDYFIAHAAGDAKGIIEKTARGRRVTLVTQGFRWWLYRRESTAAEAR